MPFLGDVPTTHPLHHNLDLYSQSTSVRQGLSADTNFGCYCAVFVPFLSSRLCYLSNNHDDHSHSKIRRYRGKLAVDFNSFRAKLMGALVYSLCQMELNGWGGIGVKGKLEL